MDKIIVNFAPTGLIPRKAQNPLTPISNTEIIEDVLKANEIGISMVHLHVRDATTENPCYKKEKYALIIEGIRRYAPDLVISVSTSGRYFTELDKRMDVLELAGNLKPDLASLTTSSLNFNKEASLNTPETIQLLAAKMKEKGIKPELEVFDTGMVNYAKYLMKKGLIKPPFYFNILLGNIACAQADFLHTAVMLEKLPNESIATLAGIGNQQLPVNSMAIAMGYGVRTGLEDNIWQDGARTQLASNSSLLERINVLVGANEKTIMKPAALRELLQLKPGNGEYGV
jgi:uncharacterized protein (DUF849 family)